MGGLVMTTRNGYTQKNQLWESYSAATIRAISKQHDLYFRAHQLYRGTSRLPFDAAHLQTDPEADGLSELRGISDGLALRLLHSDIQLYLDLAPETAFEQLIYELLEQLRVESLVPETLPGIRRNLREHFEHWLLQFHYAGLTETAFGLMIFTVAQICWGRLNRYPPIEETEDLMEATRAGTVPLIGTPLAALPGTREDQAAYAEHAKHIAAILNQMMEVERKVNTKTASKKSALASRKLLQFLNLVDITEKDSFATVNSGISRLFQEQGQQYRIFTTQFDRIINANKLVRAPVLHELRQQLDEQVRKSGLNTQRLTRLLQQVFAVPHRNGWDFGLDEGYIDGNRLAQLITSPTEQAIFKQEAHPPRCHAMVTFMLDCSGSMKQHGPVLAVILDVFARAMEKIGVGCEILGFSTRAWNGGRALKAWRAQGKPEAPGRLNETSHMIFRDADVAWNRSRNGLAALLRSDIYKEGIDGEAVEWACNRLLNHDADRRILMVISDGCPMDSATAHANDEYYMDNHLQQVVHKYDRPGQLEIYGLGVGLDLSPYYRKHLPIDLEQGLDNQLLRDIVGLWK
uniref:Aerobic cobaltochelatase CobT subunit (EC) n=1 Tax=uncultured Thiotrichaceae bacterium TaxID=298394 RepID=A0A6S6SDN1_9GAMM|nr:MAG: Aerobic cobaltochelatase CobT subunit (EC [uncultured Thiotrichaceae bacterium]